MKTRLIYFVIAILLFTSCKKDDISAFNDNAKAPVSVEFDNVAGSSDLQLSTGSYTNSWA